MELLAPSDGHRLGGAVAGDDGDEARVVCVLRGKRQTHTLTHTRQHLFGGGEQSSWKYDKRER